MNNFDNDVPEIDLVHIFEVLISNLWIICIAAFIGACSMFYYASAMLTPLYQSSAMFYVNNNNISIGSASFSISSADISASQSLVDTYISILRTRNTLDTVIEKFDLKYTYAQLVSMISVSSVNSTEIFRVTITSPDPAEACRIANGITEVLPDKISEIVTGSSARVVDYAAVNPTKVSPSVTKYTFVGLAAGAVVAALIIVLIDFFDDTINDDSYLLNMYDEIATLAVIPNLHSSHKSSNYNSNKKRYGKYYGYDKDTKKDRK